MRPTRIKGGVTAARGFAAAGVYAGIKKSGNLDLALLVSERPAAAAGAFTTNAVRAASVDWCESHLPASRVQAIVVNSGNANACTGTRGVADNAAVAGAAAAACDRAAGSVLTASTGVIGHFLPVGKIRAAMPGLAAALSATPAGGTRFARAIMTTDLKRKEAAFAARTRAGRFIVGGCCKGSGMIHPKMATMLAFVATDAALAPRALNACVKRVVDRTFNNLTVDGDTSTNDMLLVMANGASGVHLASAADLASFEAALYAVCNELCAAIAADGEGATKRIEIRVSGGKTYEDARIAAKAVANSNLVKTAMFGNDPNWGRILCAIGYSGARFDRRRLVVRIGDMVVCKALRPVAFPVARMQKALRSKVVVISADLGQGRHEAVAHTCDFSYDYVKINAEYHT
jgi:glutamate N-acetyltransferase/amino-acid N-acetyltransferase